ncbi:Alpha/Beta hydrolase protein [Umbelopsis sp. AD052]|nr:Alpha/Beta hydrolase protein [Umbelopsis sp. AD052]
MDHFRQFMRGMPNQISVPTVKMILQMNPPTAARALMNDLTRPLKHQLPYIKKVHGGAWRGAWIGENMHTADSYEDVKARVQKADLIIFTIHGGGFRIGTSTMYMKAYTTWIEMLKDNGIHAIIMSVKYRLSPEAKYPEPTEDCVRAYQHLRNSLKVPGNKIVVTGDSAGGALLFETMMDCHAPDVYDHLGGENATGAIESKGYPDLPAAMMLSSPLVTEKFDAPSWKANDKHDIVTTKFAKQVLREYFDPEVAPTPETMKVLALSRMDKGFEVFIPKNVIVYVGKKEVMRDDILELCDRVKRNSTINVQVIQENLVHDWYMIRDLVKKKSILEQNDRVFIRFIKQALEQAQGHPIRGSAQFKEVRSRQGRKASMSESFVSCSSVNSSSAQTALESSLAAETELLETLSQVGSHKDRRSISSEAPIASPTILGLITV